MPYYDNMIVLRGITYLESWLYKSQKGSAFLGAPKHLYNSLCPLVG